MKRLGRAALGGVVAFGLLSAVPAAVFAAQPACGDTLTSNTTLTADLDCSAYNATALSMGANRVVLNLNGHTIWGYTGADTNYGVDTDGYHKTVVKNGTIANTYIGVYVYYSNSTQIKNLEYAAEPADFGNSSAGVYVSYGAGNTLTNVNLHGGYYGLETYGSAETVMTNSKAWNNYYGVYTEYDSKDKFQSNVFKMNEYGIYDDYSGANSYLSNTAKDNNSEGFYIDCDSYGTTVMTNNTATNNGGDGFYTYECYQSNGYNPGSGSTFSGNTSTGNGGYGWYDYYSINSVWTSNRSNNNDSEGFYIDYPGGFIMTYNTANGNGSDGFYFPDNYSAGYYNLYNFGHNTANNNDGWGFDADYGVPGKNNTAHDNSSGNCYNVRCN